MEKRKQLLAQLGALLHVGILSRAGGAVEVLSGPLNPIWNNAKLIEELENGARKQSVPFILQDEFMVCFASLRLEQGKNVDTGNRREEADPSENSNGEKERIFFIGPMGLDRLGGVELHRVYRHYGVKGEEPAIRRFSYSNLLQTVSTIGCVITGDLYTEKQLSRTNDSLEPEIKREKELAMFFYQDEEENLHHTYQEERELLECIRSGKVKEALEYSANMDVSLGRTAKKEVNHWRYAAVAAVTLCTRAAIEGGVSPASAYQMSDFYIQKLDEAKDIKGIIEYRNRAVEDLTTKVYKKQNTKSYSNYIERCKEYVEKHYREKIYLSDIADKMGLSETYLSRLFHKETGIRLQDYIVQIRLDHAANLLLYSEEPILKIAEYVNFPSQSYFGRVFKEKYHMSPRVYREQFKPKGF
ncbi:MAG: AraC family transcriptional regulator [Eubacteriales bacterium]|nr:AraC family transcriptional regulator [Eubacteriales bacterium]